ncbi:MAG: hypothetical protein KJ061_01345 [Vicinamibacteraceae bacterium]|nr:hypothetical protein [Vicinamibacteraceae bacterium]
MTDPTHAPAADRRRRGPGADLFADEVVVDFPALAPVVERMRDAFLAADRGLDRVSAAVRLTGPQAGGGRRVPLNLALRCTCHRCGGRGEVWSERCVECGGSGHGLLLHQLHVFVPSGTRDGDCLAFTVSPAFATATRVELRVTVA